MMKRKIKQILVMTLSVLMALPSLAPFAEVYAASTIEIRSFSTSVQDGAKKVGNDWVWEANTHEADHRYTFRINYSIAGTFEHQPGDIRIVIPKQLLKDRDGNYADYYDVAVPEASDPDIDESTEFVYEENGNDIVITNRIELPAGQNGFIEVSYLTSKNTLAYKDYGSAGAGSDDFVADITVTHDAETVTASSAPLKVYMDTTAEIMSTEKRKPTLYKSWQSGWGNDVKPSNDSDYWYLVWEVRSRIEPPTQPYNFSLADIFDTSTDGEVVGFKMQGEKAYRADSLVSNITKTTYKDYDERYDYVLTKHLKTAFPETETVEFKNYVQGCVDPVDQVDDDSYAQSNKSWLYQKPSFVVPSGHFMLWKWGLDYSDYTVYDSEDIRNFSLTEFQAQRTDSIDDLRYHVEQIGYPYPWTIQGSASDPSNYGKIPVKYVITDNHAVINDNTQKLTEDDYEVTKLDFSYHITDAEFDDETQAFVSKAATFKNSDVIDFYAEFNGSGSYVKVGTYNLSTNTFTESGNYLESVSGKTLYFKENCTGWKVETENAYYMTDIHIYPSLKIKDSAYIKSETDGRDQVWVTNTAESVIYNNSGSKIVGFTKKGTDYIIGTEKDGHIKKKSIEYKNNKSKRLYTVTWEIDANEDYMDPSAVRRNTIQSSGTFYDLLPVGGELIEDSLEVKDESNKDCAFTYKVKHNYKGSGRDLLIVSITDPAGQYKLKLKTSHSWDSIKDHGLDIVNNAAYETGNESIGDGSGDTGGGVDEFVNLDPDVDDEEKFLYTSSTHRISIITAANLGLYKKVKSETDENYVYKTTTYPESDYSYYIRFATDNETTAKNLIVFDSLENYVVKETGQPDKTSAWHGTLKSVDTTVAEELGANPVVYYSTVANLDLEQHHDLTDTSIWSTSIANIEDAKAVAIDIRKKADNSDFVLDYDTSMSFVLNMESPATGSGSGDDIAYNNIYLNDTVISKEGFEADYFIHQDYTQIKFRVVGNVIFDKVAAADHSEKIPGIKFRLFGTSDYDNDIDVEAESDSSGRVKFAKIEKGTYELQELGGSDDWLADHETKTVTIDDSGNVTIEGLRKESGVYVFGNEPRIHNDIKFRKKNIVGGNVIEETESGLMLSMEETSAGPYDTADEIAFTVTVKNTGDAELTDIELTIDENGTTHERETIDPGAQYTYEETYYVEQTDTNAGHASLTGTVTGYDEQGNELSANVVLDIPLNEIVTHSASNASVWTDRSSNPNIPGVTFKLEGTSDYGTEVCQYSTSSIIGFVSFKNIEKGTYTLTEVETNDEYILNDMEFRVIIDENGNVSITDPENANSEFVQEKEGDWYLFNEPYHDFSLRKRDAVNTTQFLEGAEFRLTGTSDYGTKVDKTAVSNALGRVTFDWLESGTYVLQETVAPENHVLDDTPRLVTIDKEGNVTIEGITETEVGSGFFIVDNARSYEGQITITKEWNDGLTGAAADNRPEPTVYISTKEPETFTGYTLTYDANGSTFSNGKPTNVVRVLSTEDSQGNITNTITEGAVKTPSGYFSGNTYYEFDKWYEDAACTTPFDFNSTWFGADKTVYAGYVNQGGAYAVLEDNGDLIFFRSTENYSNNTTGTFEDVMGNTYTGRVFSGIETTNTTSTSNSKWYSYRTSVKTVSVAEDQTIKPINCYYWFYGCSNMTSCDLTGLDTSNVTNMNGMFYGCQALASLDVSGFDTSNVTNMNGMFNACNALTTLDVSGFDTSNVTTMASMFASCSALTSLDLSSFDTSNVTTMSSMFYGCQALTSLDVSGFDTSNVTDMSSMFNGCNALASLDVSGFDTSKVTTMSSMFSGCRALTTLDLSSFDTSKVTNMNSMFYYCTALTTLDLSSFDTSKVTNMRNMFYYCYDLTTIYVSDLWDTSAVTNSTSMFIICTSLPNFSSSVIDKTNAHYNTGGYLTYKAAPVSTGSISGLAMIRPLSVIKKAGLGDVIETALVKLGLVQEVYAETRSDAGTAYAVLTDASDATGAGNLIFFRSNDTYTNNTTGTFTDILNNTYSGRVFAGIETTNSTSSSNSKWYSYRTSVKTACVADGQVIKPINCYYWFYGCNQMTSCDLTGFDTSNVTDMSSMFNSCNVLTSLDLSSFDTSNVTNMYGMFRSCSALTSLDLSGFDTSNVTDMNSMFLNCEALTSLDLSSFDTSSVTDMSSVFFSCSALTSLDLSGFDTSNVTNMYYMFYNCSALTSLDVSSFDTSKVTHMSSMFRICNALTSLDVSGFDTSNVKYMDNMFEGCSALTSLDVSGFNTSNVTRMDSMFYNCRALTTLDLSGFDTSKVTNMNGMFRNCNALTSLDISGFDTSNVTEMIRIFQNCSALTSLDVSSFDTSNVTNMLYMFNDCSSLASLDVSGLDTSKVTYMSNMFEGCRVLTSLDVSGFDTSNVTTMNDIFGDCNALANIALGPKSIFTVSPPKSNWTRYSLLSGMKTYDDVQITNISNYDGTSPGWYKTADATIHNEADLYDGYISKQLSHANIEWVHVDDDTWTYTFNVYDERAEYYVWEDIMQGYSSDTTQNDPQMINKYEGFNVKSATVTNNYRDQAPPTPPVPPVHGSGSLTVTNELAGDGLTEDDSNIEFEFTVTLSGRTGTEIINGIVFKDGVGTVYLKGGDSITFTDLEGGVEYSVEQKPVPGFETSYENDSHAGTITSGEESVVAALNTKQAVPVTPKNGFSLKKTLKGGYTFPTDGFEYRIAFAGLDPDTEYEVANDITLTTNSRGEANISLTLHGGDVVVFRDLPVGSTYQITELENSYTASYKVTDASGGDFRLIEKNRDKNTDPMTPLSTAKEKVDEGEVITVLFTNSRDLPSPTGVKGAMRALLVISLAMAITLLMLLRAIRKEKATAGERDK